MPWVACDNCGHERVYSGPKPVGTRIDCPADCGARARVVPAYRRRPLGYGPR